MFTMFTIPGLKSHMLLRNLKPETRSLDCSLKFEKDTVVVFLYDSEFITCRKGLSYRRSKFTYICLFLRFLTFGTAQISLSCAFCFIIFHDNLI